MILQGLLIVAIVVLLAAVIGAAANGEVQGMLVGAFLVLSFASSLAYWRLMAGMGRSKAPPGRWDHLIGRQAVVVTQVPAGVWVCLDDREWPARLPPFTAPPPEGTVVEVEAVADDILVVRPKDPST
jgi:membrane protein implicated in regulation of membrane protease activity